MAFEIGRFDVPLCVDSVVSLVCGRNTSRALSPNRTGEHTSVITTDASIPFLHPKTNPLEFLSHARERTGEWALMRNKVAPDCVDHTSTVESSLPVTSRRPSGLSTIAFMTDSCPSL
jgi:hypothetical protein